MMREKLIELIQNAHDEQKHLTSVKSIQAIADYLIANGVIVQFPKVGKKIYIHQFDNKMKKVVVECKIIKQSNAKESFEVKLADGRRLTLLYQFIGKTVFLSREDAERALKEDKGGAIVIVILAPLFCGVGVPLIINWLFDKFGGDE